MNDYFLLGLSVFLMVVYHIRLRYLIKHKPGTTAYGRHKIGRQLWVKQFSGGKDAVLVVQTLRNWIMSATFLASTAILMAAGIIGFSFNAASLQSFVHELNFFGAHTRVILLYKMLFLSLFFLVSFFAFSFSVRFFTHAAFQINLAREKVKMDDVKTRVYSEYSDLQHGAFFYFLGLRLQYLSVPIAFWLIDPIFMLAGTLMLLVMLYIYD